MKICIITNLYEPHIIGGAEKYVSEIAKRLSLEDDVVVITTDPFSKSRTIEEGKIRVYRFYPLNLYSTYFAKQKKDFIKPVWHLLDLWNPHSNLVVRDILRTERPNVVHTHNLGGLSLSVFSAIRSSRIPHVHTLHDFSLLCPRATLLHGNGNMCSSPNFLCKYYRDIKKYLSNSPEVVISPSNYVLKRHLENGFFKKSKSMKLPLGADLSENSKVSKEYDLIKVLFVGQIVRHKGAHILIDAFRRIVSSNVKLDIVGKGADMQHLQSLASDDKRIEFHGFVSSDSLKKMYMAANIVVVPSVWHDNSPMVIYEALSYGAPIVGSRIGGIPELIEDGYNGRLFEAGNILELKQILENLISDRYLLRKLSKNALSSSSNYSMERHIEGLRSIYMEVIGR